MTIFSDAFAYAPGDLVLQGGWAASPITAGSPEVISASTVDAIIASDSGSEHALTGFDVTAPWILTFTIDATGVTEISIIDLYVGTATGDIAGLTLTADPVGPPTDQFDISLDYPGGSNVIPNAAALTPGLHTARLSYDGALLTAKLDGVTLSTQTVSLATVDTSTLGIYMQAVVTGNGMHLKSVSLAQ